MILSFQVHTFCKKYRDFSGVFFKKSATTLRELTAGIALLKVQIFSATFLYAWQAYTYTAFFRKRQIGPC